MKQTPDGEWIHPPTKDILGKCKLQMMEEYISKRKETVRAYIEKRPILKRA